MGIGCPARCSCLEPSLWNLRSLSRKSQVPRSSCAKSHARNWQIFALVLSVTCEVGITPIHCLVFHESARRHPVDQLQTVAVEPAMQVRSHIQYINNQKTCELPPNKCKITARAPEKWGTPSSCTMIGTWEPACWLESRDRHISSQSDWLPRHSSST